MEPAESLRPFQRLREFRPLNVSSAEEVNPVTTVRIGILCEFCQRAQAWLAVEENRIFVIEKSQSTRRFKQDFAHHASGVNLEQSFRNGCHLCTLIWHSLVEDPEVASTRIASYSSRLEQVRQAAEIIVSVRASKLASSDLAKGRVPKLYLSARVEKSRLFGRRLDIFVSADSDSSAKVVSTVTKSNHTFTSIKKLLDKCIADHHSCNTSAVTAPPKRLLEVIDTPGGIKIYLKDAKRLIRPGRPVKYVCLSYCWGGKACIRLTRQTHNLLRAGIKIDQLPQTIADAAEMIIELGVSYLWVDAMCIIQDSLEDWKEEAASMGEVYQGSFLTIAARGATDCEQGLFSIRDPLMYTPCPLVQLSAKTVLTVLPYRHWFGHDLSEDDDWPLYTRGWVVQERVLARRTLGFGPYVSWDCCELSTDEFGPCQRSSEHFESIGSELPFVKNLRSTSAMFHAMQRFFMDSPSQAGPKSPLRHGPGYVWQQLLYWYTDCQLTNPTDRLVAISGLIKSIAKCEGWKNVAGLWSQAIIEELIWTINDGEDNQEQSKRTSLRPTWSWISVTGGVSFESHGIVKSDKRHWKELAQARFLDEGEIASSWLPRTSAGAKPDFMLEINCPVLRMQDRHGHKRPEAWPGSSEKVFFVCKRDCGEKYPEDREMLFLPLLDTISGPDTKGGISLAIPRLFGLVVAPSREFPGTYERLGCVVNEVFVTGEASRWRTHRRLERIVEKSPRKTLFLV